MYMYSVIPCTNHHCHFYFDVISTNNIILVPSAHIYSRGVTFTLKFSFNFRDQHAAVVETWMEAIFALVELIRAIVVGGATHAARARTAEQFLASHKVVNINHDNAYTS